MQNLVQSMSSVQINSVSVLTQLRDDFQDNLLLSSQVTPENLTALQVGFDQLWSSLQEQQAMHADLTASECEEFIVPGEHEFSAEQLTVL